MFVQTNFQRNRHSHSINSTSNQSHSSLNSNQHQQQRGRIQSEINKRQSSGAVRWAGSREPTVLEERPLVHNLSSPSKITVENSPQNKYKSKCETVKDASDDCARRPSLRTRAEFTLNRQQSIELCSVKELEVDSLSDKSSSSSSRFTPTSDADSLNRLSPVGSCCYLSEFQQEHLTQNKESSGELGFPKDVQEDTIVPCFFCRLDEQLESNNNNCEPDTTNHSSRLARTTFVQLAVDYSRALGAAIGTKLRAALVKPFFDGVVRLAFVRSKQNLELISAFCLGFATYQLETWRLLIDSVATDEQSVCNIDTNLVSYSGGGSRSCVTLQARPNSDECVTQPPIQMISVSAYNANRSKKTVGAARLQPIRPSFTNQSTEARPATHTTCHTYAACEPHIGLSKNGSDRVLVNEQQRPVSRQSSWSSNTTSVPIDLMHRYGGNKGAGRQRIFEIGSLSGSPISMQAGKLTGHLPPSDQLAEHRHQHHHRSRQPSAGGRSIRSDSSRCNRVLFCNQSLDRTDDTAFLFDHQAVSQSIGTSSRSLQIVELRPDDDSAAGQHWSGKQSETSRYQQRVELNGTQLMRSPTVGSKLRVATPEPARRSASPGKLSLAGARRRLGFKSQKGLSSLSVQRSEEVVPPEVRHLARQATSNSLATDSGNESSSIWFGDSLQSNPQANFIEGLGPGQIVSRQALVSPYLGDIQLSLSDRRGQLEVEVVRARQLLIRSGTKGLPSPHVKVYLTKDKKCIAKRKTQPAIRSLDPLYQQLFTFQEDYANCVLQVIVWGDYGRKERKSLMGIVQISLAELDLSSLVIAWFRLFNAPSMASSTIASKTLRHTLSASIG